MSIPSFLIQNAQHNDQWYFLAHYSPILQAQIVDYGDSQNLYQETDLNDAQDLSPMLITIETTQLPILINDIENGDVKGIFIAIEDSYPLTELINQLRKRLFVQFGGGRKAIFHYQNPRIASHFFGQSLKQETNAWMGTIKKIAWFDNAPWGNQQWNVIDNDNLNMSSDETTVWLLTDSQEKALMHTVDDRVIDYFFEHYPEHYSQPQDWCWCYDILSYASLLNLEHIDDLKAMLAFSFEFRTVAMTVLAHWHEQESIETQTLTLSHYQQQLKQMQEQMIHGQ
ncbi:DUF4123 domain-containing protein [Photobacterium damselae]|uniref:DUF4123 domain-containing protein n=1 Tax=Photobacterium damselae TaxID=38293 RepID=UPI003B681BB4